jgi:Papain-like cysteine protease AvrRpt2
LIKYASLAFFSLSPRIAIAAPVNAKSSGTVPPLKQPLPNACWATVATMMYSWKNNLSTDIPTAMKAIGQTYFDIFNKDTGLDAADKPGFLIAAGLKAEAPQNYAAEGWAKLIDLHGPLWVTTNEGVLSTAAGPKKQFAIHARIVTAIFGDGTPAGTTMVVVDPADGKVHTETMLVFAKRFEDVARIDVGPGGDGDIRPQVVHY